MPSKKETKQFLKIAGTRALGVAVPIIGVIIYLTVYGIWEEFIDYAIIGIGTFSNKISYKELFFSSNMIVRVLAIVFLVQLLVMFIVYMISFKKKELEEKEWFKTIHIPAIYLIASAIVIIPIADKYHFAIGSICGIIVFSYIIYKMISIKLKDKEKLKITIKTFSEVLSKILIVTFAFCAIYKIIGFVKNEDRRTDIKHLKNTPVEEYLYDRINYIDSFIQKENELGKEVYVLDLASALYSVTIDRYQKNYDMFNLGNFGGKGTEGIIQDLDSKENAIILIKNSKYKQNWQHPNEVTDFVRENYRYIGELDIYEVYIK